MATSEIPLEFEREKLILRIDETIAADPNAISGLVDRVMGIARLMSCAKGKEMEIELALREALANAVVHGCKSDPGKQVQCCVGCDEGRGMLVVVRDPGEGYDPFALPDPTEAKNVFSTHGRGIFLINRLVDEVQIRRNGTEIFLRVK
ncbi:MAG TPA: ATP-binding protein [Terriglobales bacterium]|nr:ATP-binding protein [Terriglobales bacterium]